MSLQHDVMFPGLGRKGLQLPERGDAGDHVLVRGAVGCTPSSVSPAPPQGRRSLEL